MSYFTAEDHAKETDPALRALRGLVRRVLVSLTSDIGGAAAGVWQMLGAAINGAQREVLAAVEVWQGIGFAARPRPTSKAEAIIVALGSAGNARGGSPQAVALRDEDLRKLAAADLAQDETAVFNSLAHVRVKADGTVEVHALGGAAVALATKADVQAIATYLQKQFDSAFGHTHATPSGPTTTITENGTAHAGGGAPNPTGTTVLKGQ